MGASGVYFRPGVGLQSGRAQARSARAGAASRRVRIRRPPARRGALWQNPAQ